MLNDTMGKFHFWVTFLGTYAIYYPMHYLGFLGVPRRYYAMGNTDLHPESAQTLNEAITIAALIVGAVQVVFLYNLIWSYFNGKPPGGNPWRATTLEWQTPDTPPKHGNFGPTLPGGLSLGVRLQRAGRGRGLHIRKTSRLSKRTKGLETTPDVAELGRQARACGHPQASRRALHDHRPAVPAAPSWPSSSWWLVRPTLNVSPWIERSTHPDRKRQRRVCHARRCKSDSGCFSPSPRRCSRC